MKDIKNWIALDIYYDTLSWHKLINEVIKPNVDHWVKQKKISRYHLYFRDLDGPKISIYINAPIIEENISVFLSNEIRSFLDNMPSQTRPIEYPLTRFFMNNYNNVVLTHTFAFPKCAEKESRFRFNISRAIVAASDDEPWDANRTYTLFLYMQLGMIKAMCPKIEELKIFLPFIINYMDKKKRAGTHADVPSDLIFDGICNNPELINEIISDIWTSIDTLRELFWMKTWIAACSKSFKNSDHSPDSFLSASDLVAEHLYLNRSVTYQTLNSVLHCNLFEST